MSSSGTRVTTYKRLGDGTAITLPGHGSARRVEVTRVVSGTSVVDYVWQEGDADGSARKETKAAAYAAPATITSNGITVGVSSVTLGTDISVTTQQLYIKIIGS